MTPDESTTQTDLAERALAMVVAGDRGDFDGAMRFYAPDAVFELVDDGIRLDGAPAIRGFMEDWFANFDDHHWTAEEVLDVGNGVVLVVYHDSGRPGGSTFTAQERAALVSEWKEGLIVGVKDHGDLDEARAAAQRLAESRG
ncbi:MAG: nuclear transport factor 2 family protein [Acidimicrobiales bacterium]